MNEPPKEMMLAKLDVLVMPNGEILCAGKTLGWVDGEIGQHLSNFTDAITGKRVNVPA